MPADVPRHFASTSGVADKCDLIEVQLFDELSEVIGVRIHVVAGRRLARASMATPIVRDCPVAVLRKEEHLSLPCIAVERPAVREDDAGCGAPVVLEALRAVAGGAVSHVGVVLRGAGAAEARWD